MSSRWFKVVAVIVAALVVVAASGLVYMKLAERRTPQGQPPLVNLTDAGLGPFIEAFNAEPGATRIVVLLSPT